MLTIFLIINSQKYTVNDCKQSNYFRSFALLLINWYHSNIFLRFNSILYSYSFNFGEFVENWSWTFDTVWALSTRSFGLKHFYLWFYDLSLHLILWENISGRKILLIEWRIAWLRGLLPCDLVWINQDLVFCRKHFYFFARLGKNEIYV